MKDNMTPLTDVLEFIVDNRGKTVPTSDSGIPLIATNCIKHSSIYPTFDNIRYVNDETMKTWFRAHPKPNDIIFVNKGTPGRVCLVPDPVSFCFAQDMMGFRCDPEKIDYQYLFAVLRSDFIQEKIENFHVGLVIPHFKKGDLGHIKIPRLSSRQLELAVGKLYIKLSKKIELNNRVNAELEAMVKTLYEYWFVQFDFPDVEGKPYKSSGGKMVYNEVLKREIPEGWKVSTLANWVQNDKTGDWGQESEEGNYTLQVYCIRGTDTNDISSKGNIGAPKRFILHKNNHKLLSPFEFVIEISGGSTNQSTGRMATITNEVLERFDHPLICSNFCKAISLVDSDYFYNFEYLWQRLYDNDVLFGWEGKTSGIKNLLFDSFINNYNLPMPPKELAKKFFDFADIAHKKNQNLLKENKHLEDLRDWLLPMLMNGQVTVN